MNESTQQMAPSEETTQAVSGVDCPVCGTSNPPFSQWCVECGFRLDTTPGDAPSAEPGYTVTDGRQTMSLKMGENTVGRLNADVFLSDPSVSRRHAVITVAEDGVTVRDENSANGTKLDGKSLEAGVDMPWPAGRTAEFGTVRLKLVSPEGEGAGEELEEPSVPDAVAWLRGGGMEFALMEGTASIGRRPGNDIVIPDPFVSGHHADITITDGSASVTDAGSSNGTFIGETRLESGRAMPVDSGATVKFGRIELEFEWALTAEEASDG